MRGLGASTNQSWEDIEGSDFGSWSVGIELKMGLGGNIRARNHLRAALLRQQQQQILLDDLRKHLANSLDTAIRRLQNLDEQRGSFGEVVQIKEKMLKDALTRLAAGRVGTHEVLQMEEELVEAQEEQYQCVVDCRTTLLDLESLEGSLLDNRGIKVSLVEPR